jgi:hypothetical protein
MSPDEAAESAVAGPRQGAGWAQVLIDFDPFMGDPDAASWTTRAGETG